MIELIRLRKSDALQYQYEMWLKANWPSEEDYARKERALSSLENKPLISILMPVYNVDEKWLRMAIDSVRGQIYPEWELCIADDASTSGHIRPLLEEYVQADSRIKVSFMEENQGISGASNQALGLAKGEYIGLLDNDDELTPDALYEVVKLLNRHPDADMIYSDEDKITVDGKKCEPYFKPDWSPDLFFCHMYTCHFGVYRKEIADGIKGFRKGFEGSQDYDFVLRFIEHTENIHHIPKILYHWRKIPGSTAETYDAKSSDDASQRALTEAVQRRFPGTVEKGLQLGTFRVRPEINGNPKVSIIIPTKDKLPLLKRCIGSIRAKADYPNYEIIVVDNGSEEQRTIDYLKSIDDGDSCRVLTFDRRFNFSAMNNMAAREARGEYLLFMNNDTEVFSEEWMRPMLEYAVREEIGAVGAKLIYEDNTVQHAGILLGVGGIANHAFYRFPLNGASYFGQLNTIRNCSAVTAACMMVRKSLYDELGGFDEEHCPVAFNDVDFCLRLRERGFRIVYTPYAVLYHHERATRGDKSDPEIKHMESKWAQVIGRDPYLNPNFSRDMFDFTLKF